VGTTMRSFASGGSQTKQPKDAGRLHTYRYAAD
jgi:hypothetical protein